MKIKLGIAPIAWSNDDMPELGGDTPIEQCLEEASLAGFTGIELGGKFPRNPGITNFLINKFKLKMPGGWYGSNLRKRSVLDEWSAMQDHLNLLKMVDGDIFIFADVSGSIQGEARKPLSLRPKLELSEWKEYCNKINEISNRLALTYSSTFQLHSEPRIEIEYELGKNFAIKGERDEGKFGVDLKIEKRF